MRNEAGWTDFEIMVRSYGLACASIGEDTTLSPDELKERAHKIFHDLKSVPE